MGFFIHYNSYLRFDIWNWLDFIVVVVSLVEIFSFGSK